MTQPASARATSSPSWHRSASRPTLAATLPADLLLAAALLATALGLSWQSSHDRFAAALATTAALLAGRPVARHAWRAARLRHLDMHVLITLATTGAILVGEWLEAATGMVLFRCALLIDEASKQRAHQAIKSLLQLNPTVAHRLLSDERSPSNVEDVVVDQLRVGDVGASLLVIFNGTRLVRSSCGKKQN